ncbi:hypothetical protein RQM59_01920 [Flavobacteriaceae bacterium S356]|uniref:Oligosaccharide repeat unit polymerase n=1 Tax=Asprobacillus argus TaxID=3076534 RepID=A0ABU3LBK7_9FLAO|nr:hypothetical protein [Flavobacteriaceae bacterium S356]
MMIFRHFFTNKGTGDILFFKSLVFGILIWIFFHLVTPLDVVNPLSWSTIMYIICNYLAIMGGYVVAKVCFRNKQVKEEKVVVGGAFFKVMLILILTSSLIRYVDLFFVRDVSFTNAISSNKYNLAQAENFSIVLGLLGSLRILYFVPYLFYTIQKKTNLKLLVICLLLFLVPMVEGYLRGSRRLIFEPIAILITIIMVFNYTKLFSKSAILVTLLGLLLVMPISNFILKERVDQWSSEAFLERMQKAPYNKFVPIQASTKDFILEHRNNWKGSVAFNAVHLGQYITHGVYEFDYLQSQKPTKKKGLYNSFVLVKLSNKLGLTKIPLDSLMNPTGRVTYITFFGGQFLDFGWFSLVVMFFYGGIQNRAFIFGEKNDYLKPITVVFIFTNVFLLVFNFMRAQMLVVLILYLLMYVLLRTFESRKLRMKL